LGWQVVRIGVAASAHDSDYERSPVSREADIALGVAYAGLFAASAIYGFSATTTCAHLKERQEQESDQFLKRERPRTGVACCEHVDRVGHE
jgi:hypothetical protein